MTAFRFNTTLFLKTIVIFLALMGLWTMLCVKTNDFNMPGKPGPAPVFKDQLVTLGW